jgi:putative aldouronate transport system permease protein
MKRMDKSEFIFKIFSYFFATIFALFCLYPFIYAISAALSGKLAMIEGKVILFPIDIQFEAFRKVIDDKMFWLSYANTLFLTFYGTLWAMFVSIYGAYALSKSRLIFRRGFNFLLVFTMWFNAGMIPTYLNYRNTREFFHSIGIADDKWVVVIAMGLAAFNIILLRNAFEGVPKEIEEAAIVDGANDFQIVSKVYVPMSKAAIATVALFYGLSRWNGYFWARQIISNTSEWPLQVYIRKQLEETFETINYGVDPGYPYSLDSLFYAMIVCAIIPIIIIYPYIQKYFARGVNLGGVKE